jgi:hypothetical protein
MTGLRRGPSVTNIRAKSRGTPPPTPKTPKYPRASLTHRKAGTPNFKNPKSEYDAAEPARRFAAIAGGGRLDRLAAGLDRIHARAAPSAQGWDQACDVAAKGRVVAEIPAQRWRRWRAQLFIRSLAGAGFCAHPPGAPKIGTRRDMGTHTAAADLTSSSATDARRCRLRGALLSRIMRVGAPGRPDGSAPQSAEARTDDGWGYGPEQSEAPGTPRAIKSGLQGLRLVVAEQIKGSGREPCGLPLSRRPVAR